MEKATKKPVDRQATFDTDPLRAHLTKGNLKLPVIEAQDKDKPKLPIKENKSSQHKITDNPTNVPKGKTSEKSSKNEAIGEDNKTTVPNVKVSDSNIKSNILSNINRKVVNNADKESKEVNSSKDNSKKATGSTNKVTEVGSSKDNSQKAIDNTSKVTSNNKNSVGTKNDKNKVVPTEQKNTADGKTTALSKSTSQKINEAKVSERQKIAENSKAESNKKNVSETNKQPQQTNKSVNEPENKLKTVKEIRSKSPEKHQTTRAAVLKDLNIKRSEIPAKGKNASSDKELKASTENVKASQNSKSVASKSPQSKSLNTDDKDSKLSPRKQEHSDQGSKVKNTSRKTENIASPRDVTKEVKTISNKTLPGNNAPAETYLLNDKEKSDKPVENGVNVSSRSKSNNEKYSLSIESSTEQSDAIHLSNENKHQKKPALEIPNQSQTAGDVSSHHPETLEKTVNSDTKVLISGFDSTENKNITDKELNASVKSKNETYVLSPSPTKVESKSPRGHRLSRPSRLSPSNESVEPIKLEQRPISDKTGMDVDRRESYAQVYAERNTLLNAEHTYRKRIKQLEDEANGFLKAIDELTTENKYLRGRVDKLENELRTKGDSVALDKIAELEKRNAELESKIKESENVANVKSDANELRELKEQVVKLQSENQKLNEDNSKLKSENNENTKKLRALEAEKKSLETSVTGVESEKLDKIQDLNKEQKQLNKQLNEFKTKNKGLEKKVDALEYENKTLSEALDQKKKELSELLGVMKDENKFDDEIKDLKNQILKLNKEKKESDLAFNKEKRILNEKLRDKNTALDTKTKDADELKIKLDQVESEHKKMKENFDPLKKLSETQKKEIAKLKEEIERLQNELKERRDSYAKLENESESASKDLKETKDELEKFNKELQKIVSDKESQISKLINQMDTMREERETERKTAKEEKEKLVSETEKVEAYQENTKRLEADLKHFSEKLDESKLKEKQLSLQLEDRGFEVSNLEQQIFEMNMKMENYSKRMSDLDREKRDMEREKREWEVKKDKIDDIEASNKRLLEENKRLRNQIEMSSYVSTYRPSERDANEKPVVEAWTTDKNSQTVNHAIYVQNEKPRDHRKKKVHLAQQQNIQKKRMPFSKSSPVKVSRQNKQEESKVSKPSTHRSLEDLRKVGDNKTPESEHSLPELQHDTRLTGGYGGLVGYREIHKNRIRAAHKRIFPIH